MTSISRVRLCNQHTLTHTLVPYLTVLVGFDVGSSDQKRNFDVKLVELPLVQWEGELAWREITKEHLENLQMSRRNQNICSSDKPQEEEKVKRFPKRYQLILQKISIFQVKIFTL